MGVTQNARDKLLTIGKTMITCALWDIESRTLDQAATSAEGQSGFYLIQGTLYINPTMHKSSLSIYLKT